MDNNFDDYEVAGLEAMTIKNRNHYMNEIKKMDSGNIVKPAKYTGHIDKSSKRHLSRKHLALALAGVALTGIGLFNIVGRPNSNPHELTANELKALSSNSENFSKLNLSSDKLQSVIDFSNNYQVFYDRVQDENFVLSDDDIHELQTYLDTYKTLSKSVIADKVSSVTDVDAKDIIVVDNSRDFQFVTIAVRGKDNGGTLLNVGPRFNTKPLPITLRNVAQNFIDLKNASVEFNIEKFNDYANILNSALGNLNTLAGSELMYDSKARNFKEVYFEKANDSITYTNFNDMDR